MNPNVMLRNGPNGRGDKAVGIIINSQTKSAVLLYRMSSIISRGAIEALRNQTGILTFEETLERRNLLEIP